MSQPLAEDVARVLTAFLEAKAWFRRGITDQELAERTNLSGVRVAAARREAETLGLVERHGLGSDRPVAMLTPLGVARARGLATPVV
jgi:hypothetical protein